TGCRTGRAACSAATLRRPPTSARERRVRTLDQRREHLPQEIPEGGQYPPGAGHLTREQAAPRGQPSFELGEVALEPEVAPKLHRPRRALPRPTLIGFGLVGQAQVAVGGDDLLGVVNRGGPLEADAEQQDEGL